MSVELLVVAGVLASVAAASLLFKRSHYLRWFRRAPNEQAWRIAARRLGLQEILTVGGGAAMFKGTIDGFQVGVDTCPDDRMPAHAKIRVGVGETAVQRLEARQAAGLLGANGVVVGHERFDKEVLVDGDPLLLGAVLSHATRYAVIASAKLSFLSLRDGVVFTRVEANQARPAELHKQVMRTLRLATLLQLPADIPKALAVNARRDPVSGVRERCLRLLIEHYAKTPATLEACRRALRDRSARIRLLAARHVGEEGRRTLLELAQDCALEEDLRAGAVLAIGARLPQAQAATILREAIASAKFALAVAAIGAIEESRDNAVRAALRAALESEHLKLGERAVALLESDPEGEAQLLDALEHTEPSVRLAAALALGRSAGVAAVATMRAAIAERPLELGFRRAVLAAIAAIQGRVPGAEPGQLAVAEAEAGELALTLADAQGEHSGRLSLEPAPRAAREE
jgi:hypothetical protein